MIDPGRKRREERRELIRERWDWHFHELVQVDVRKVLDQLKPQPPLPGGPTPETPALPRPGIGAPHQQPKPSDQLTVNPKTGTVKESGGLQSIVSLPAKDAAGLTQLSDSLTTRKGVDQGFNDKPVPGQAGIGPIKGNPIPGMTNGTIGGLLGRDAASDVKGAPDNSSSNLAGGFLEDFVNGLIGLVRQGDKGTVNDEAAKQLDQIEKEDKADSTPPPPPKGDDKAGGGTSTPLPEGEGRGGDRLNLVGGSTVVQRQKDARTGGQGGAEVLPNPEGSADLRDRNVNVPNPGETQRNLVGQPGQSQSGSGGVPSNAAGTPGSNPGNIDPNRD